MEEKFYANDVTRITGLKRTRLEQWIERGYFIPTTRAQGPGTQNIYSRGDLYALCLLERLLLMGVPRERAGKVVFAIRWERERTAGNNYVVVKIELQRSPRGGKIMAGEMYFAVDAPQVSLKREAVAWVINLRQVFEEIDSKIEKLHSKT
jgi:DNA-binding transcriptional MerR regulator